MALSMTGSRRPVIASGCPVTCRDGGRRLALLFEAGPARYALEAPRSSRSRRPTRPGPRHLRGVFPLEDLSVLLGGAPEAPARARGRARHQSHAGGARARRCGGGGRGRRSALPAHPRPRAADRHAWSAAPSSTRAGSTWSSAPRRWARACMLAGRRRRASSPGSRRPRSGAALRVAAAGSSASRSRRCCKSPRCWPPSAPSRSRAGSSPASWRTPAPLAGVRVARVPRAGAGRRAPRGPARAGGDPGRALCLAGTGHHPGARGDRRAGSLADARWTARPRAGCHAAPGRRRT